MRMRAHLRSRTPSKTREYRIRGGTTVSRDRHLIAIFADTATYLPLKIHGVTWLLPASAEATQSEDPQRLVVSCTYHSLYLKKKSRTRANTYCSSDLQREIIEVTLHFVDIYFNSDFSVSAIFGLCSISLPSFDGTQTL